MFDQFELLELLVVDELEWKTEGMVGVLEEGFESVLEGEVGLGGEVWVVGVGDFVEED